MELEPPVVVTNDWYPDSFKVAAGLSFEHSGTPLPSSEGFATGMHGTVMLSKLAITVSATANLHFNAFLSNKVRGQGGNSLAKNTISSSVSFPAIISLGPKQKYSTYTVEHIQIKPHVFRTLKMQ